MLSDAQIKRKKLMEAISKEITQNEPEVVLKGGTALLLVYKLDRFSEGMDFDVPRGGNTDFEKHIKKAAKSIGVDDIEINIKKDTDTTKRFMLHYGAHRDNDPAKDYPLKIEISLKNLEINHKDVNELDGIRVYKIGCLAEQKIEALSKREAGRDIYDVEFLTSNYPNEISDSAWQNLESHISNRGINALSFNFEKQKETDNLLKKLDSAEIILKIQENIENHAKNKKRDFNNSLIYYDKAKVATINDDGNISLDREGIENCGMPPQWIPHMKKLLENSLPEGLRRDALVQLAVKNGSKANLALELAPYVSEWPGRFSVGDSSFAEKESATLRSFCQLPQQLPQGGRIKIESRLPVSFFDPLSEQRINTKPSFSGYQDKFTAILRQGDDDLWTITAPDQETERGNVIVKPAHPKYPFIAENEYLCMELAQKAGLQAPRVFLFRQPGITLEPQHIIIERFDVKVVNEKPIDLDISEFAPLMGLETKNKYDTTTEQLFDYAGSVLSPDDMKALANAYLFGCIVRNGDMHAKNFSMEYKEGKYILSPVYDMVNTDVYGDYSALALPLGGENSPKPSKIIGFLSGYLSVDDFESMAMSVKSNLKDCSERAFAETSRKNAPKFQKKLEQSISEGINLVRGTVKTHRSGNGGIENSSTI